MDKETVALSEAEWKVMEELWKEAPATGRELTERLESRCGWNRSMQQSILPSSLSAETAQRLSLRSRGSMTAMR